MRKILIRAVGLLCFMLFNVAHTSAEKAKIGPKTVYTFDARPLNDLDIRSRSNATRVWDTWHVLGALQGLVNREDPRLYIYYCREFGTDTDQFWFDWFRGEDGWLAKTEVIALTDLTQVVRTFRNSFDGLVVYDPKVPATAIVASTAAGCENLLPVLFDAASGSIYSLLSNELRIPVKLWLVNQDGSSKFEGKGRLPDFDEASSGSAKVDAHRWAQRRYLQSGRCGSGVAAYYVDSFWLENPAAGGPGMHTLCNHDYFIAHKGFFFDLSPWGDEAPNDDSKQSIGLDKKALLQVLHTLYDRAGGGIIKIGGFPPWPFKYTTHAKPPGKHEGVPTEWEFGRLISQFNAYKEADAAGLGGMANASFFQHYPLAQRFHQPNPVPRIEDWLRRGLVNNEGKVVDRFFVGHYVGDYDSPSWLYKAVPAFFKDPARGRVPLGWAFDPNLAERAPQAWAYAYRYATTNDFFISGNSGAGYLNARALTVRPDSNLPSGLDAWTDYCKKHFTRWDLSITGFILDGSGGSSTDLEFAAYRQFSPNGAGTHFEPGPAIHAGMPTCPERDLPDGAAEAAKTIAEHAKQRIAGQPGFLWARSILKSPQWYAEVSRLLAENYPEARVEVVDPFTFFGLIKVAL